MKKYQLNDHIPNCGVTDSQREAELMRRYTRIAPCAVDDPDAQDPHAVWLVVGNQRFHVGYYHNSAHEACVACKWLAQALERVLQQENVTR